MSTQVRSQWKPRPAVVIKPSYEQLQVLRYLAKDPLHIIQRYPGGFWAPPSVPVENQLPTWSTGTTTIRAMDKRGWTKRTMTSPDDWKDPRELTPEGLAQLTPKEQEGVVLKVEEPAPVNTDPNPAVPPAKPASTKKTGPATKPTHVLKVKHKDGHRGTIGSGWQREDGSFYIQLDPCVVISWTDDVIISLFPRDPV